MVTAAPPVISREQPRQARQRGNRGGLILTLIAVVLVGAGVLLYCFNPAEYAFYPTCAFHQMTGLQCPGCGGTRALYALVHGDLGRAFQLNPLMMMLLPVAAWYALRFGVLWKTGRAWPHPFRHPAWIKGLGAGIVLFWIVRNLPLGF